MDVEVLAVATAAALGRVDEAVTSDELVPRATALAYENSPPT
jgi:enoyl-CoA hydratase/carnithine racemase